MSPDVAKYPPDQRGLWTTVSEEGTISTHPNTMDPGARTQQGSPWMLILSSYLLPMGKQWKQCQPLFWGGSKITAEGDCSHEIKRRLLLGRKVLTNLDSIFTSRDITLPTKVCLVKAMVFPVVIYGTGLALYKSVHFYKPINISYYQKHILHEYVS